MRPLFYFLCRFFSLIPMLLFWGLMIFLIIGVYIVWTSSLNPFWVDTELSGSEEINSALDQALFGLENQLPQYEVALRPTVVFPIQNDPDYLVTEKLIGIIQSTENFKIPEKCSYQKITELILTGDKVSPHKIPGSKQLSDEIKLAETARSYQADLFFRGTLDKLYKDQASGKYEVVLNLELWELPEQTLADISFDNVNQEANQKNTEFVKGKKSDKSSDSVESVVSDTDTAESDADTAEDFSADEKNKLRRSVKEPKLVKKFCLTNNASLEKDQGGLSEKKTWFFAILSFLKQVVLVLGCSLLGILLTTPFIKQRLRLERTDVNFFLLLIFSVLAMFGLYCYLGVSLDNWTLTFWGTVGLLLYGGLFFLGNAFWMSAVDYWIN